MSVETASCNMEDDSSGSPGAAASCPCWVMLDEFGYHRNSVEEAKDAAAATAAARTSTDLFFHVSFLLAPPPASSRLIYYVPPDSPSEQDDGDGEQVDGVTVVAVHGDALLLEVSTRTSQKHRPYSASASTSRTDYFVYDNGPARPPALVLLPGCYFTWQFEHDKKAQGGRLWPTSTARKMHKFSTGILRCGEDELLVAQFELSGEPWDRAELCVLRLGRQDEWELKQAVPIVFDDDDLLEAGIKGDEIVRQWQTVAAIPAGDRFLCWVDYRVGFLLCDMAADATSLKLRYVALPVRPHDMRSYPCMKYSGNLAACAAGGGAGAAVRFVNVEPRCCCSYATRRSTCERCSLFTVTTWTLSRLSMEEPMEWVKDGVLGCEELWALPAYKGLLPQVKLELPFVSSDDPNVICFMVCDPNLADTTRVWMVEVDTRNKAVLSVVPYTDRQWPEDHVAAKLWF